MANENFQEEIKDLYFYGINQDRFNIHEKVTKVHANKQNWIELTRHIIRMYGIDHANHEWTRQTLTNNAIVRGVSEKLKEYYTEE